MRKPKHRPQKPIDYASGMFVNTEQATYYVKNNKRFRLFSDRVVQSWSVEPVIGSESSMDHIQKARMPLGFRDGTLIHNMGDGRVYLISNNKRRQITSPDVLRDFGWKLTDAILVSQKETNLHDEGGPLS